MRLIVNTAPQIEPITLAEAKAWCRIDTDDHDWVIASLIKSVRAELDGGRGWLGRALAPQTWDLKLDGFPSCIKVPLPPLRAVELVTYVDASGATQTLAPERYRVSGIGSEWPAQIEPAYGESWPVTRRQDEAVSVRFIAGYDVQGSPPEVNIPPPIREAMLRIIAHRFDNRESVVVGTSWQELPDVEQLLGSYQVHWFS